MTITAGTSDSFYNNSLGFRTSTGEQIIFADDNAVAAGTTFDLGTFTDGTEIEFFILQDGGTEIGGVDGNGTAQVDKADNADGSVTFSFEDLFTDPADNVNNFVRDSDFNDVVFTASFGSATVPPSAQPTVPPAPGDDSTQTVVSQPVALPGGSVAASITTESTTDDDTAELSGVISLSGFLSNTINIAFINDASGSTGDITSVDVDGDGINDSVFKVDVFALADLNAELIANGLADADLAVISFSTSASLDAITTPATDADGNGVLDVIDALVNPGVSASSTNYADALQEAIDFFNTQAPGESNFVYFLSDGEPNTGGAFDDEVAVLTDPNGINATLQAFGVVGSDKAQLDIVDNTGGAQIFDDIADLSAGITASPVDVNDITSVDILVDGVVQQTLTPADLTSSATGVAFGPVTLTGLDPSDVNTVSIEAVLTTDDGSMFDLTVSTDIVGSAPADASTATTATPVAMADIMDSTMPADADAVI